jgi:hypothetical protein
VSFTIWSRFRQVVSTPSGRRHLLKTWRFSAREAVRAATGAQLSEVLVELEKLASKCFPTLKPEARMVTPEQFALLANRFSAGKQSGHHEVYSLLDLRPDSVSNVLEVGIGTNEESAASTMGKYGTPGASLRMWEEFFPNATIYGADVDVNSHIFSDRITSHYLDSTNQGSLGDLYLTLSSSGKSAAFDLVIDDGLHTPESNLRVLTHLLPLIRPGGFYVVEDIPRAWKGFWSVVANSLTGVSWDLVDATEQGSGPHCFLVLKKT